MPRDLTVAAHRPPDELARRDRHVHAPVERTHGHLLWLVAEGRRVPDVALVGDTANWGAPCRMTFPHGRLSSADPAMDRRRGLHGYHRRSARTDPAPGSVTIVRPSPRR